MTTTITEYDYHDIPVLFQDDAFLEITSLAKEFNKTTEAYFKRKKTKKTIKAITLLFNIPKSELFIVNIGSSNEGIWAHPKIAIDFARWIDSEFAIWCELQIDKILYPGRHNSEVANSLDCLIPEKEGSQDSLEELMYRSYKTPFGIRAFVKIKEGKAVAAQEYKPGEILFDVDLLGPVFEAVENLKKYYPIMCAQAASKQTKDKVIN